jgi:hypothetical protein
MLQQKQTFNQFSGLKDGQTSMEDVFYGSCQCILSEAEHAKDLYQIYLSANE